MTFGYEYALLMCSGLGAIVASVTHFLRRAAQTGESYAVPMFIWCAISLITAGSFGWALLTGESAWLATIDGNILSTLIILAAFGMVCAVVSLEITNLVHVRRAAAAPAPVR